MLKCFLCGKNITQSLAFGFDAEKGYYHSECRYEKPAAPSSNGIGAADCDGRQLKEQPPKFSSSEESRQESVSSPDSSSPI
jgi:hypothetical protein